MNTPALASVDIKQVSSALALDLAAKLQPPAQILEKYGLTDEQFNLIANSPQFKRLFTEAKRFWNSDGNAPERVRSKCAMLVEDSLLEVYAIVHDVGMAPAARLDGFKTLAKMAGMGKDPADESPSERFSITINLDNDRAVTIDGNAVRQLEDDR